MEGKDTDMDTQDDENTVDGDGYPPDSDGDEAFDPMDLEAEDVSGPGHNVPTPRAAGVRAAARQRGVARPTSKVKKAKHVRKNGGRILTQQKRRQALELRKAGASYYDIAQALGYSDQSGARKAVIKAFGEVIQEPVSELRTVQVERLNHMLMTLWPRVQQGDDTAIRTSLSVMDKMDRLMGTDQAAQMEVNVTNQTGVLVIDGNKDDFIAQMRKMAGVDANGHNVTAQQQGQAGTSAQPALPSGPTYAGPQYPPGMTPQGHGADEDIVDAEVVEDDAPKMSDCTSPLGTVCKDPACPLHYGKRDNSQPDPVRIEEPGKPSKKKFSFGVDPTVKRKGGNQ